MKFEPEFKRAISELPSAEKDKLIFRLLKHDLNLANKLLFELVDTDTVDDKRAKMEIRIFKAVELMTQRFFSIGYLLMDLRYLSGEITEHVRITKDKFGDPYLNLVMLVKVLELNQKILKTKKFDESYTFNIYIVARVYKVLIQIQALHEDFHMEFNDLLQQLGNLFPKSDNLMRVAINNQLDINWLLSCEIPSDIVAQHKYLRQEGFLK